MTFRGPGSGFVPAGIILEVRQFDDFASKIGATNRLLQGLNRNIASAVGDFNSLGRTAQSVGRNLDSPFKRISDGARNFGQSLRRGTQDLFFVQSATRQAVNTLGDLGRAFASPVAAAVEFEDAFANVTKTVPGLSQTIDGQNLFSNLTTAGENLRNELTQLSNQIPVTFEELSELAGIGGQFGLVTRQTARIAELREELDSLRAAGASLEELQIRQEAIVALEDQVVATLSNFSFVTGGLGEATNISAERAGEFLAQMTAIAGVEDPENNILRLGAAVVELGNTSSTTEEAIGQLALRIFGAGISTGVAQDQLLGIAAAFSSTGVRAEAGGTAISNFFRDIQRAAAQTEDVGITAESAVAGINNQLDDLFADLVRLEAQTGQSGRAFVDSLAGLSGEELGRQLGDARLERLFNVQTQIDQLQVSLSRAEAGDVDFLTSANEQLDTFIELINLARQQSGGDPLLGAADFQAAVDSDLGQVFEEIILGLGQVEDRTAALDALGVTSSRTRDALDRVAGAGDLITRSIDSAQEQFNIVNEELENEVPLLEQTNALVLELNNRYSTTASALQTFQNQIKNTAVELGNQFLPIVTDVLTVFGERLPAAIDAVTTTFGPLANTITEALSGFADNETGGIGVFFDRIIQGIANFDTTPIETAFRFIVDNSDTILSVLRGLGEGLLATGGFAVLAGAIIAVTNPIGQLILAVTALRVAWDENFLGFRDIVTNVAAVVAPALNFIAENLDTIGAAIAGGLAAVGTVKAIAAAGAAIAALGAGLAAVATPLGLFVTGSAALAAAWQTNFGGFRDFTLAVIQSVSEGISQLRASFEAGTFDPIIETINRVVGAFSLLSGLGGGGDGGFNLTQLVTGGIDTFFDSLNQGLTDLAENWTTFETTIALGLAVVQSSFSNANQFIAALPNPITAWLGGTDTDDTDIAGTINQALISGLDDAATELDTAIQNFTTIFDRAVAAPEGGEQSPGQVFVDRFLEPFRTIELPDIDLSPIGEAFANIVNPETLEAFASGFGGIADALARFDETAGGDTIGRFAEALGTVAATELEQLVTNINNFAQAVGAVGEFTATYAGNIGQFFSAFVETPIQQIEGLTRALQGLSSIERVRDLGSGLADVANGLLLIGSAPIVNFAEVFTGTEIEPPQIDFSSWGVGITEAIAEIQRVFSNITIEPPISFQDLIYSDDEGESGDQLKTAIQATLGNAIAEIRTDLSNLFSDIEFTAPDLSPILEAFKALGEQIKALFSPAALFEAIADLQLVDTSSLTGFLDSFKSLFSDGEEAGEDLDTGLAQGIDDNSTVPVEAAKNMSERVLNEGIYLPLAVRSPSEATRQVGADLVAGFALGLQDITPILEALQTLTTTILEQFTLLSTQLGEILIPNFAALNEQFLLVTTNLQLVSEGTAVYTPVLVELTEAERTFGQVLANEVIPPLQLLDQVQNLARASARRLERAVKTLTAQYKRLAAALGEVRRSGGTTGAIPQTTAVNPPAFQRGGSFLVPSSIPDALRGPTGGMLIEVHPSELVQIFNRAMTRQITDVPQDSLIGRTSVREPAFSGAGISNQITNLNNTTNNNGQNEYHLHVTSPVSSNIVDSYELLRTLSRRR